MATNLGIDDRLINSAKKLGKHKTKREAVTKALVEYIQHHKEWKVMDSFGKIDYDPHYNYKKQRKVS
jgi:hypothetical protein